MTTDVYEYAARRGAIGKMVDVKWVRVNTGSEGQLEDRCRLVAQELGPGERLYALFVGPRVFPSSGSCCRYVVAERDLSMMLFDSKCGFLHRSVRRSVYTELPRQDIRHGNGQTMELKKAMCGATEVPKTWSDAVRAKMLALGAFQRKSSSCICPLAFFSSSHGRRPCTRWLVHSLLFRAPVVARGFADGARLEETPFRARQWGRG